MKEEIIAGLKNAIERGSSLDAAAQSFISAGYNAQEVREAAAVLRGGATNILNNVNRQPIPQQQVPVQPKPQQIQQPQQAKSFPAVQQPQQIQQPQQAPLDYLPERSQNYDFSDNSSSKIAFIVLLILILLLLIGGIVLILIYKQEVIDFITGLIG